MEDLDLAQPAIVFWEHHGGQPGEITRFHTLRDAIQSVMPALRQPKPYPSVGSARWIGTSPSTKIRAVARRFNLTQVRQAECDTADAPKRFRRLDFRDAPRFALGSLRIPDR